MVSVSTLTKNAETVYVSFKLSKRKEVYLVFQAVTVEHWIYLCMIKKWGYAKTMIVAV